MGAAEIWRRMDFPGLLHKTVKILPMEVIKTSVGIIFLHFMIGTQIGRAGLYWTARTA